MAKRAATTELNHDNWDKEDEQEEEAGVFVPVKKTELENRIIRKAKRQLESRPNTTSASNSPFAGFSGFGSSKPMFSFSKSNTGAVPKDSSSSQPKIPTQNHSNNKSETSKEPTTQSSEEKSTRTVEYYRLLQSLNRSVLKWMQLHIEKNPCCDFTPVFNDYKKHLDTLNVTYPAQKDRRSKESNGGVFKKPCPYGTKETPKMSDGQEKTMSRPPTSTPCFKFPGNHSSKGKDETDYGAHFASNTTNTSTFSFGIQSATTETSSGSPAGPSVHSKTSNESTENKSTLQFSFAPKNNDTQPQEIKPFTFSTIPAAKMENENEEQEYQPPKTEFVTVKEDDAFYSKRCKLFYKKDDSFADKGVGMLYLKPLEKKTQLIIRADTNLGNVLLNIMLSPSLPMSRTGKNNVLIVCVPNPPIDVKNPDSKEAIPMLIRVKTSGDADELLEQLNKHKELKE